MRSSGERSPVLLRALRHMLRTDRSQTIRSAITAVVMGVAVSMVGFAARTAVNTLIHSSEGGWAYAAILVILGIAALMTATWLNYGSVTTLSIQIGRSVDLTLLNAEQQRKAMNHLHGSEIQELAAAVEDQREAVAALPAAGNATLVLAASTLALLILALSVSALLLLLFVGLMAVALAASLAQRRLSSVVTATAVSTRITRALFALMTAAGPAKDIRTSGAAPILIMDYSVEWGNQDKLLHRARRSGVLIVAAAEILLVGLFIVSLLLTLTSPSLDPGAAVLAFVLAIQAAAIGGAAYPALSRLGLCLAIYKQYDTLVGPTYAQRPETAESDQPNLATTVPDGTVLSLMDVVVRYAPDAPPALDGICLDIQAGTLVAIVGENGAGKSTLASVVLGLRQPDEGMVTRVRTRRPGPGVSAVFQDFAQIESTVGEGVRFGDEQASDEMVCGTLKAVGAGKWLEELPCSLMTGVGSSSRPGVDLSGGQWQRLALARGTIADIPQLIVLDEATSALDAYAEQQLIERQLGAARRHTATGETAVVFITHRLAATRLADVIHVLDAGRIVESGTHEDLMVRNGLYAQMFSIQASGYQ